LTSHSLTRFNVTTTNINQFVPSKHAEETRSFVAGNLDLQNIYVFLTYTSQYYRIKTLPTHSENKD